MGNALVMGITAASVLEMLDPVSFRATPHSWAE
jgi:hypothetical protein